MDLIDRLKQRGIQPSAQRVAVARYVLQTDEHPSADLVWQRVRPYLPVLSRATVYNTLNLFVRKGLLRALALSEGSVVFDPKTEPHHHLIEDGTGRIHDIPWDAVQARPVDKVEGFEVREYQVVMRGKKLPRRRR
ncbi:MAG: Fur family transcriptional regulator [Myxococcaceae bacterium]